MPMKKAILRYTAALLLLTALPVIPALASGGIRETGAAATEPTGPAVIVPEPPSVPQTAKASPASVPQEDAYLVLDTASGEVLTVPVRDYLIGALCAEMPLSFESEALKAQVVAAHTYAARQAAIARAYPDESLQGADFSNDSSRYQAYYTNEQLREVLGDRYADGYETAAAAVDAVLPEILTYDNQPIIAAFHAMCSGRTEDSAHVWGTPVAYLTAVDSPADPEAPAFEQAVTFSEDEVREALTAVHTGLILGSDPAGWFAEGERTDSGTVLHMTVGRSIFTGQELRSIFGLRSADFTIDYADGEFSFTTRGYGHGVGMSQYGANAMAQEGSTYEEILAHYYPGTVLADAEVSPAS